MKRFSYLKDVVTLRLDQGACIGCGMCCEVCPHQVFIMSGRLAEIQSLDSCMECGACALNCPVKAIQVDAGVGCASGMINEWLQGLRIRNSGSSSC